MKPIKNRVYQIKYNEDSYAYANYQGLAEYTGNESGSCYEFKLITCYDKWEGNVWFGEQDIVSEYSNRSELTCNVVPLINNVILDRTKHLLKIWNIDTKQYDYFSFEAIDDLYKMIHNLPPFDSNQAAKLNGNINLPL